MNGWEWVWVNGCKRVIYDEMRWDLHGIYKNKIKNKSAMVIIKLGRKYKVYGGVARRCKRVAQIGIRGR